MDHISEILRQGKTAFLAEKKDRSDLLEELLEEASFDEKMLINEVVRLITGDQDLDEIILEAQLQKMRKD